MTTRTIRCKTCKKALGTISELEINPCADTNVVIEKGIIYFQCQTDNKYIEVAPSTFSGTLLKPGWKRIT